MKYRKIVTYFVKDTQQFVTYGVKNAIQVTKKQKRPYINKIFSKIRYLK